MIARGAFATFAALAIAMTIAGAGCSACDVPGTAPRDAAPDALSSHVSDAAPSCNREGSLDAVEKATECMVRCADAADPHLLRVSAETLVPTVLPGGTAAVIARIKNVGQTPATLCLRAESSEPVGWDRIAGVGTPPADRACEHPRFPFPLRTLSWRDADVDELKVGTNVLCARTLRVVLLPGRTLSKSIAWIATRLPPPPRPWEDDAGHRFYPKDIPVPLSKGTYRIETDFPFVDAPPELLHATTTIDVRDDDKVLK